ncbi:hypothetical protein [Thermomonospora umbrina]|uniref:Uncharacterized protein n=1 Tax=Thermomonospora umbrina TaxID=111806 RepID=A0A3D9SX14_9ACTN|nr:hypothetical protein [Thermomonospora umbrina]REF00379.1 hypothetical protein DFJ69_5911 [Thermomonospora umbrina]
MAAPKITDDQLRRLKADHEAALERLEEERDAKLRAALADGRQQKDLVTLTGYTRETIRQALNPDIKAAARKAAAERYAARKKRSS